jgi:hypothetical protein
MNYRAVFLLMLAVSLIRGLAAQDSILLKVWDPSVIAGANTAIGSEFMNEDEKRVILLCNLARADGPLFAETILRPYIQVKKMESNPYITSLFRDLRDVRGLPMLRPEKVMYNIARNHAVNSGKKGQEGHKGFKKRYGPAMETYREVGENIYYGQYTPEEIVLQLLIDEGIQDLGHRKNLLNPRFNSIGVSIKPHKTYRYNCVMSFGLLPRSYEDFIQ